MLSVDLMSLWNAVCSVLLCSSVRNRKHPLYDTTHKQHVGEFYLSRWGVFSLTERTEFTEPFGAHFELTEGLRHTEFTEAFQLRLAVTLCDIGWLNVSVEPCVFCSSVIFCERKIVGYSQCGVFSLTERTDLTDLFAHCFDSTEGLRHTEFTERFS